MVWFLPLGLSVGVVLTRTAQQYWKETGTRRRDVGLLILLGWIPLLAWIASHWIAQY
jgi:hypothetical protein